MRRAFLLPAIAAAVLLAAPGRVRSQDPVPLYPDNYRVLLENDRVRVVDFTLKKADKEQSHSHPAHLAVFLADFKIRFTLPDGSTRIREARAGETAWSEPTTHASENIGGTDAHGILIEMKSPGAAGAVGAEPGAPASREITAVTLIHGLPGRQEDLREHLLSLAAPTRAEAGCRRYDLFQSPDRPHEFMRLEVWDSLEALEAHKRTPHLRASFDKRQREGWTTEIMVFKAVPGGSAEHAAAASFLAPAARAGAAGTSGMARVAEPVVRVERLDPRLDELIAPGATPEQVAGGIEWAEGPVWDSAADALLFSDVPRNAIFRWSPLSGVSPFLERSGYSGASPFAGREPGSNGLTLDARGRLVFCQHGDRRIARREPDGTLTVLADRFEGRRLNSPNDLVYRSNGDLFFTDPPFGLPGTFQDRDKEMPFQGVYRLSAGGRLTAPIRDLAAPNGIAFSPDERTLYVSNADMTNPIWTAYEVRADGTLGAGRQFAEARDWVAPGEGVPDGMKVDDRGNLFAAGPGGVHIFAKDGTRLGRIVTGVPTGNLAWGGDGGDLYIAANHAILRLRTLTRGARADRRGYSYRNDSIGSTEAARQAG